MKSVFQNSDESLKGAFLALLGFSSFAIGDVAFKYLTPFYPTLTVAFFASSFVLITLLIIAFFTCGIRKALETDHPRLHLLRGLLLFVQFICIIYAFSAMSLAKAYALFFAAPFITAILSIPLLKEKVSLQKWISVFVGFLGVLIILRPGLIPLDSASIAAMWAAVSLAFVHIVARKIGKGTPSPLAFGLYVEFVIVPLSFVFMLSDFVMPSLPHLLMLAGAGVLGAFAMVMLGKGFTLAPPALAAPMQYVQILWGIFFGYVLFNDPLDLWVGLGALIVIISGIWLIVHEKKERMSEKKLN